MGTECYREANVQAYLSPNPFWTGPTSPYLVSEVPAAVITLSCVILNIRLRHVL